MAAKSNREPVQDDAAQWEGQRANISLTPPSANAEYRVMRLTGANKTAIYNRAIQVLADIMDLQAAGGGVYFQGPGNNEFERQRFYI